MKSPRWQDDAPFLKWMIEMRYVLIEKDELRHPFSGDGIVLYMHEAWCAGRRASGR